MTIAALRTDEARFRALSDWPYASHAIETLPDREGLRLVYVDEGPRDAATTFLCLHGQPTWSYLYRRMIPVFSDSGARVVAPDLFGFGRSDKPVDEAVYTFDFHRETLIRFVEALDLKNITLVVQDWGGILGLTLPLAFPQRIARLIVMNTTLAVGALMKRSTPHLTEAEMAAYDAPFPDATYKAGVRRFPQLVPITPDDPGAAISREAATWGKTAFKGPSFMAIGMMDPVLGPPVMHSLRRTIAGCPEPMVIPDGGHFVQEWGEPIAKAALAAFA